jgi:hypothetical protein
MSHTSPLLQGLWETVKETITSCTQDAGMEAVGKGAETATDKVGEIATDFKDKSPV